MEPGSVVRHERRDKLEDSTIGPSFTIEGDGSLMIGDRKVAPPMGEWVKFKIKTKTKSMSESRWDLKVIVPGQEHPLVVNDIPHDPKWQTLEWYGFVADGTGQSTSYVDDVYLIIRQGCPRNSWE